MKIVVCTMAIGKEYQEMVNGCIDVNSKYCKKFGYDFHVAYDMPDIGREIAWNKLRIMKNMGYEYSHIFWVDADALFFNHHIPLTRYIHHNYDYVFSTDAFSTVNTGVWMVRNSEGFKEQVDRWWNDPVMDKRWWEQAAITRNLPKKYSVEYTLAGLYNDAPIDLMLNKLAKKIQGLKPDDIVFAKERARLYQFDEKYHHVCHFAGRHTENKGLKQCIEKVVNKLRI